MNGPLEVGLTPLSMTLAYSGRADGHGRRLAGLQVVEGRLGQVEQQAAHVRLADHVLGVVDVAERACWPGGWLMAWAVEVCMMSTPPDWRRGQQLLGSGMGL